MNSQRKRTIGDTNSEDLSSLLNKIIEGSSNDALPSDQMDAQFNDFVTNLNQKLEELKRKKEERELKLQAIANEELRIEENKNILRENTLMIQQINELMAKSNSQIPRQIRISMTQEITNLINKTVTDQQIIQELENDAQWRDNIKDLFNAIIVYYTEMASYTMAKSPQMLAQIGSAITGTVLIGGALYTASSYNDMGSSLLELSRFVNTATTSGAGLYFLQRSGLPIDRVIQTIGSRATECVENVCKITNNGLSTWYTIGLETLKTLINPNYDDVTLDWDARSGHVSIKGNRSVQSITNISTGTARSKAKLEIESILHTPEDQQVFAPIPEELDIYDEIEIPVESQLTPDSLDSSPSYSDVTDFDSQEWKTPQRPIGGKHRTRQNRKTKSKIKRTGKKGGKMTKIKRIAKSQSQKGGKMTKKRKNYKRTMKKYKSKTHH